MGEEPAAELAVWEAEAEAAYYNYGLADAINTAVTASLRLRRLVQPRLPSLPLLSPAAQKIWDLRDLGSGWETSCTFVECSERLKSANLTWSKGQLT
jgi:hypothetical protein